MPPATSRARRAAISSLDARLVGARAGGEVGVRVATILPLAGPASALPGLEASVAIPHHPRALRAAARARLFEDGVLGSASGSSARRPSRREGCQEKCPTKPLHD